MTWGILVVGIDEEGDEVFLTCLLLGTCLLHGLSESHVSLVVCQILNYVWDRNLKDDVHTALEVKSETDLSFQALLVRINTQILHRVLVVLLCNGVFNLCRLAVIVVSGSRERQIEDACKRQ